MNASETFLWGGKCRNRKSTDFPLGGGGGGPKTRFFREKVGFWGVHDRVTKTRQDRNPPIYTVFKMPYVRSFSPPPRGTAYFSAHPPPLPPPGTLFGCRNRPGTDSLYSIVKGSVIACTRVRHSIPYIGLYYYPIDRGS